MKGAKQENTMEFCIKCLIKHFVNIFSSFGNTPWKYTMELIQPGTDQYELIRPGTDQCDSIGMSCWLQDVAPIRCLSPVFFVHHLRPILVLCNIILKIILLSFESYLIKFIQLEFCYEIFKRQIILESVLKYRSLKVSHKINWCHRRSYIKMTFNHRRK